MSTARKPGAVTAASPAFSCAACEIRSRAVCSVLSPEELRRLNAITAEVTLAAEQPVFYEGDPAAYAFNVTAGVVRLSKMLADGRRQVTGFLFPADFLGFAYRDRYGYTAEAITPARLCRFPRDRLALLFDELPQLERRMLAVASNELEVAQDQMLLLGRKTARERLASFLALMARRAEERGEAAGLLELPMTRADIADHLGLTVETVSRTFTQLAREGLIEAPVPQRIRLPRPQAIRELAAGDAG